MIYPKHPISFLQKHLVVDKSCLTNYSICNEIKKYAGLVNTNLDQKIYTEDGIKILTKRSMEELGKAIVLPGAWDLPDSPFDRPLPLGESKFIADRRVVLRPLKPLNVV